MVTGSIRALPTIHLRHLIVAALAATVIFLAQLPQELAASGRMALIVSGLAILGWVCTRVPESIVALTAVLTLVLAGVISEEQLFAALGSELVWLLISAFVIASVAKEAGLTERLVAPLLRRGMRVAPFFLTLAIAIIATAFVLPSTSGRAALLLPIFTAIAGALPDPRLIRALALLFPSVILLSAGASLIGAGAHLLAAQAIWDMGGIRLGYLDWVLLGLPFSAIASLIAVMLILWIFVPRALWLMRLPRISLPEPTAEARSRQRRIGFVLVVIVGLWMTSALHGIGMALVALIGALVLLTPPFTAKRPKEIFRAVDTELLLYMTATVLIAEAMTGTGTDRWLAGIAIAVLPATLSGSTMVVVAIAAVTAVLAHLAITSRSARAAVLIPAVALPLAALGHDPALMILITVMGTGFCQTMMASAKPVAIFGNAETAGFDQHDLFRLALPLAPAITVLLIGFALLVWPAQLSLMRGQISAEAPALLPPTVAVATAEPAPITMPQVAVPTVDATRPVPRPDLRPKISAPQRTAASSHRSRDNHALRELNRVLRPLGFRLTVR